MAGYGTARRGIKNKSRGEVWPGGAWPGKAECGKARDFLNYKGIPMDKSIEQLTRERVRGVLEVDTDADDFKLDALEAKVKQAKIGMAFVNAEAINKRIQQGQAIQIVAFIANDPEERKNYIEASMPHLLPKTG